MAWIGGCHIGAINEKPWYVSVLIVFLSEDCPRLLDVPSTTFARDIRTLEERVSTEGEAFLTKTLPMFAKSLDLALQGEVPLTSSCFRRESRRVARPLFLRGLTKRVFTPAGKLKGAPCIITIRLLRQVLLWCKKVEKGYSDESLRKAIVDFIDVDASLPVPGEIRGSGVLARARAIIDSIFEGFNPWDLIKAPQHGPGSVAWNTSPVGKRNLGISYTDLERVFRPLPWFRSLAEASMNPHSVLGRPQCKFGVSRIAFVLKDSGGPRIIGLEPEEYQWVQQAIKAALYHYLENHPITRGHINFTDQEVNRAFALLWRLWITLDLSKASDRNSLALVRWLFGNQGALLTMLEAARTPGTILPDGSYMEYRKFAPMGSAICFPLEALVFFALAVAAIAETGMPLQLALRKVYVYGDDLVVPVGFFKPIQEAFASVALVLNKDKCCIAGRFRESCGQDAFDGINVTPVRLKKVYAVRRNRPPLVALIKHARNLFASGYHSAASELRRLVELQYTGIRWMRIPSTPYDDSPILAWPSAECTIKKRFDRKTGCFYVKGWALRPQKVEVPAALDVRLLRESLARGGGVGIIMPYARGVEPAVRVKALDRKYAERLHRVSAHWTGPVDARQVQRLLSKQTCPGLKVSRETYVQRMAYKLPRRTVPAG